MVMIAVELNLILNMFCIAFHCLVNPDVLSGCSEGALMDLRGSRVIILHGCLLIGFSTVDSRHTARGIMGGGVNYFNFCKFLQKWRKFL